MLAAVLAVTSTLTSAALAAEPDPPAPYAPTRENTTAPPGPAPAGMVWIPGGEFSMGADAGSDALCMHGSVTRDAQPVHRVSVGGFWMDATEVTNEQFARFVEATAYVTIAERAPQPADLRRGIARCRRASARRAPRASAGRQFATTR